MNAPPSIEHIHLETIKAQTEIKIQSNQRKTFQLIQYRFPCRQANQCRCKEKITKDKKNLVSRRPFNGNKVQKEVEEQQSSYNSVFLGKIYNMNELKSVRKLKLNSSSLNKFLSKYRLSFIDLKTKEKLL